MIEIEFASTAVEVPTEFKFLNLFGDEEENEICKSWDQTAKKRDNSVNVKAGGDKVIDIT